MYTMMKLITVIAILLVHGHEAKAVTVIKGTTAILQFIYPCDSTKVTLQQSNRIPFYTSTDGPSLSLPENQIHRFRVKNMTENERCYLKLTITDLMTDDQGTYILFIYKDRQDPFIDRVFLEVAHPPDKASCVVGIDRGGDWIEIDCEANAGTIPGKIECFQDGVWMPPLNDRIVKGVLVKQTILIRKSQPAYCCSSASNVNKSRCECDDAVLFQESSKKRPCPTITTQTISTDYVYRSTDVVAIATPTTHRLSTSTNAMKKTTDYKALIIFSAFLIIVVIILLLILYLCYKHDHRNDVLSLRELSKKFDSHNAEECME